MIKNKIIKHLRGDIKMFKNEGQEDKELINKLEKYKPTHKSGKRVGKIKKVMEEYQIGKLRSGSKKGPIVTTGRQAIAIALKGARKKGHKKGK